MRNLIFIFSILFIIASCKEDESIIGLDLQDNQFTVIYDTIYSTATSTKYADSLSLNGASIGLLGDYNDPQFGRIQSALAFQVVPKTTVVNFGDNPIGDSVVITLKERSGYYGLDSAAIHRVRVYRVDQSKNLDDLDSTVVRFSSLEEYKGTLLAETDIVFNPNDTIGFSIKVMDDLNLANNFINNLASFENDTIFKDFFRGLIIEAENLSTNGNIVSFDFNVSETNMRLHYHTAEEDTVPKLFDFLLKDTESKRYSIFNHEYSGAPVGEALLQDSLFQQMSFIQGMNGVGMKITINNLDSLASESLWAINSAQLTLRLATESDSSKYFPPSSILVKMIDDLGEEIFIPDYQTSDGLSSAPENYNSDINGYKIRINRLLYESLLENKTSITLTIYTTSPLTKPNRAIIAGSSYGSPELRPVLYVIRSK